MQILQKNYFWHFITMGTFGILAGFFLWVLNKFGKMPSEISFFNLILLSIATFRLTHLVVYDKITDFIRNYFEKFETGPGKSINELLNCPWCSGIWISLFITFAYFLTPLMFPFILIISIAGIAIFLQMLVNLIIRTNR